MNAQLPEPAFFSPAPSCSLARRAVCKEGVPFPLCRASSSSSVGCTLRTTSRLAWDAFFQLASLIPGAHPA